MKRIEVCEKNIYVYTETALTNYHTVQNDRQIKITFEEFGSGKEGHGFDSLVTLLEKAGIRRDKEDSLNDVFIDHTGFQYIINDEDLILLKKNGFVQIDAQPRFLWH